MNRAETVLIEHCRQARGLTSLDDPNATELETLRAARVLALATVSTIEDRILEVC